MGKKNLEICLQISPIRFWAEAPDKYRSLPSCCILKLWWVATTRQDFISMNSGIFRQNEKNKPETFYKKGSWAPEKTYACISFCSSYPLLHNEWPQTFKTTTTIFYLSWFWGWLGLAEVLTRGFPHGCSQMWLGLEFSGRLLHSCVVADAAGWLKPQLGWSGRIILTASSCGPASLTQWQLGSKNTRQKLYHLLWSHLWNHIALLKL